MHSLEIIKAMNAKKHDKKLSDNTLEEINKYLNSKIRELENNLLELKHEILELKHKIKENDERNTL